MRCPECAGENCTEIELRLREEDTVQFFFCRRCEAKWWQRQGNAIDLREVLEIVHKGALASASSR